MDLGPMLWLVLSKRRSMSKKTILEKSQNNYGKTYLLKVRGVLREVEIDQKTASKTEGILEGIVDRFRLHFGNHFGGNKPPKIDAKIG